jgi:hypothetical protein
MGKLRHGLLEFDTYGHCSAAIGRQTLGRELATIHDYRQRLNQYRTDGSLVFAHQNHPWVTIWYARNTPCGDCLLILTTSSANSSSRVRVQDIYLSRTVSRYVGK